MRILLSAFACDPTRGSEPGNGWAWAAALARRGHEVTLLTSPLARSAIDEARHEVGGLISPLYVTPPVPRGSTWQRLQMYSAYRHWQAAAFDCVVRQKVSADVTHHATWGSLRLGSELWRLPWPLVYGPVGGGQRAPRRHARYFGAAWLEEEVRGALAGPTLKAVPFARRTLRQADLVLAQNADTRAVAVRLGASRVALMLADGLEESRISAPRTRPDGQPCVAWVGRLHRHKAPLLALRAFAEIASTCDARMLMVGDGPMRREVERELDRLAIRDRVSLLGQIPWGAVQEIYDSATLLLFTSLRDSFGAQVLEALGRGLPVVALNHQGVRDMAPDSAVVKVRVDLSSSSLPRALAEGMARVLDSNDWVTLSEAARQWAAIHTWNNKASQMETLYESL